MSDSHPPYPTHAVWQRLRCQADIGASASRTGGCCARVASSSRVRRTAKAQNFSSLWPCGAFSLGPCVSQSPARNRQWHVGNFRTRGMKAKNQQMPSALAPKLIYIPISLGTSMSSPASLWPNCKAMSCQPLPHLQCFPRGLEVKASKTRWSFDSLPCPAVLERLLEPILTPKR